MTGLNPDAPAMPRNALAVMASRDASADSIDFFPTPPWGARAGAEVVKRLDPGARTVWECACGAGHMAHGLRDAFPHVVTSDAYAYDGNAIHDFLGPDPTPFGRPDWVITNPPFEPAAAFAARAWETARRGVALLLRTGFLEGTGRHPLLFGERPVTVIAPFSERLPMLRGRYDPETASAAFYAWFIWIKPELRPQRFMARIGDAWRPAVEPIPPGTRQRLFRRSDLRFALRRSWGAAQAGRTSTGDQVTDRHLQLLEAVARDGGERGVTPLAGVYPGGVLATMKSFGLLEHAPEDRLGGRRFRPSAEGWEILVDLGRVV